MARTVAVAMAMVNVAMARATAMVAVAVTAISMMEMSAFLLVAKEVAPKIAVTMMMGRSFSNVIWLEGKNDQNCVTTMMIILDEK